MKVLLAYRVLAALGAAAPAEACRRELDRMFAKTGSCGGVICIAPDGTPGLGLSTAMMPWAVCEAAGAAEEAKGHAAAAAGESSGAAGEGAPSAPARVARRLRCGLGAADAPKTLCLHEPPHASDC